MATDGGFLVEDFLGAITSQLDKTQDALAFKAVNRTLTYAIKDFTMELKVFVQLDADGKVRLRTPAANEPGASSISIGFTTITRPMIEENTVAVAVSRSPSLAEAGLSQPERRRLEQLGVRTTGELQRLQTTAGTAGIARVADIPVTRLRAALTFGRPQVGQVRPVPPPPRTPGPPRSTPTPPIPAARKLPPIPGPPTRPVPAPQREPIRVPPGTRRLELAGQHLIAPGGTPEFRLAGLPLAVAEADDQHIVVELPEDRPPVGTLEMDHGDGELTTFELAAWDPWAPTGA